MKRYSEIINESYGINVFSSFSKCLTALGFKDNDQFKMIPNEFLIFYKLDHSDSSKVKSVFSRFKSLSDVDFQNSTNCSLYFGIKIDGNFEYGVYVHDYYPIGSFKLNNSKLNSLKLSQLKSLTSLKKSLVNLTYNDVNLMCKIKKEILNFNAIKFQKREFLPIDGKIMKMSLYGIGKWTEGVIEKDSQESIKKIFVNFISKYKWSDKILLNVNSSNFWTAFQIKLK